MTPSPRKSSARAVGPTLADVGEDRWLRRVRNWFDDTEGESLLGIGDDAAAWTRPDGAPLLVSTDALVEGVHFRWDWTAPRDLGHKALAVNLSDLAAMAARPEAALLALSLPPETLVEDLRAFFMGLRAEARRWGCPLVGGDLTRAPQWNATVTVLGRPPLARGVARRIVRRTGARAGQTVYATGRLGESGAGREALSRGLRAPTLIARHRRPTPRLDEAETLSRLCPDLAMLDLSDGLWRDAGRLAEASGVALDLYAEALTPSRALRRFAESIGRDPLDFILFGGEDYELLPTTSVKPERLAAAFEHAGLKTPIHPIGRVRRGRGVRLLDAQGHSFRPRDRTFDHFRANGG